MLLCRYVTELCCLDDNNLSQSQSSLPMVSLLGFFVACRFLNTIPKIFIYIFSFFWKTVAEKPSLRVPRLSML